MDRLASVKALTVRIKSTSKDVFVEVHLTAHYVMFDKWRPSWISHLGLLDFLESSRKATV